MKAILLSVALLVMIEFSNAQSIQPAILNSSGLSGSAHNIHFEFNLGETFSTTIGSNTLVTQGLLQPILLEQGPLPVLGLAFNAKRINNSQVQLDWKTIQEINNHGFSVERKKESEQSFTTLYFIPSKAVNGNASLPLDYSKTDTNSYAGKTYYRLKQEDLDGKFMYSTIRMVNGSNGHSISLKAWPIPSTGPVNISMDGVEKDQLLVFDNNGRLMKQLNISRQLPVQISGLAPGTYFVKLSSQKELVQKIIVQ